MSRSIPLPRTAPPEAINPALAAAPAQLTPASRGPVPGDLSGGRPQQERADRGDPHPLAWLATRAELRRPDTLERTFGGTDPRGVALGLAGPMAGSFFSSLAGFAIGTTIADAIFDGDEV